MSSGHRSNSFDTKQTEALQIQLGTKYKKLVVLQKLALAIEAVDKFPNEIGTFAGSVVVFVKK